MSQFQDFVTSDLPLLWEVVNFENNSEEDFRENFQEAVLSLGLNVNKFDLRKDSRERLIRKFLRLWEKRFGFQQESSSREAFIQISLLKSAWSVDRAALALDASPQAVRFEIVNLMKASLGSRLPQVDRSKDCMRFELFLPDLITGDVWPDPAGVMPKDQLLSHAKSCKYCTALWDGVTERKNHINNVDLPEFPRDLEQEVRSRWVENVGEIKKRRRVLLQRFAFQGSSLLLLVGVLYAVATRVNFGDLMTVDSSVQEPPQNLVEGAVLDQAPVAVAPITGAPATAAPGADVLPPEKSQGSALNVVDVAQPVDRSNGFLFGPIFMDREFFIARRVLIPERLEDRPIFEATPVAVSRGNDEEIVASNQRPVLPSPEVPEKTGASGQGQLEVFRWGAFSASLDSDTSKIRDLLLAQGALKAGEFELGAKHLGGSYFHFYVPQEKYAALVDELNKLALIDFTKTRARSDRASPPGKTRVVFLIKPKKS